LCHNSSIVGYNIRIDQEAQLGIAMFSATDLPMLERFHPKATYFGLDWQSYLSLKNIQVQDIWPKEDCPQTLMNAKLFPLVEDIIGWYNLLWLQDVSDSPSISSRLESWRCQKRYSMVTAICRRCGSFAKYLLSSISSYRKSFFR